MANGRQLLGQLLYGIRRLPVKFFQQMMDKRTADALVGTANVEIDPHDEDNSLVKTFDTTAIQAILDAEFLTLETHMDIPNLPTELTGLEVIYEKGGEDGDSFEDVTADYLTAPFGIGISANANAVASAYCIPKLKYTLKRRTGQNIPVRLCYFYMTTVTIAAAITRIDAALGVSSAAWPKFVEDSIVMVLRGERVSRSSKAGYQASASSNGGASLVQTSGEGNSANIAPVIDVVNLPFAIHGAFNSLTASDSQTKTATGTYEVVAGASVLSGSEGTAANAVANGSISPTTVPASSPTTVVPTTGIYLYKLTPQPEDAYGRTLVEAVVLNAANL